MKLPTHSLFLKTTAAAAAAAAAAVGGGRKEGRLAWKDG